MKILVAGCLALALVAGTQAQETMAPEKITTDSMTVIRPGPGGEVRVMTKDVTEVEAAAPKAARPEVAPDTAPRKARVVVVPAIFSVEIRSKLERELNERFGLTDPGVLENPGYTSYLVDALVNSRKVDVLEREALDNVVRELDFGESDYADLARVVKMGQMLNADYVVIPEIRYLVVTAERKVVPYIGEQQEQIKGKLATNLRVVEVATSKIIASNIGAVEDKTRFKDTRGPRAMQLRDFINGLYGVSGLKEAANVVDTAYPIKIVGVSPGQVIINRGRGALELGEFLNVYATGEMMIDPDTKESLGYHEGKVGVIRVVEVNEKTSKADTVSGEGQIQKLFICRREPRVEAAPVEPPAPKLN